MTPQTLLSHSDSGQLWPRAAGAAPDLDLPTAYQRALAVRQLRIARGEVPRGYKIGFTNRGITTGTWTNAWPVAPGEVWTARFDAPLSPLEVRFSGAG